MQVPKDILYFPIFMISSDRMSLKKDPFLGILRITVVEVEGVFSWKYGTYVHFFSKQGHVVSGTWSIMTSVATSMSTSIELGEREGLGKFQDRFYLTLDLAIRLQATEKLWNSL